MRREYNTYRLELRIVNPDGRDLLRAYAPRKREKPNTEKEQEKIDFSDFVRLLDVLAFLKSQKDHTGHLWWQLEMDSAELERFLQSPAITRRAKRLRERHEAGV